MQITLSFYMPKINKYKQIKRENTKQTKTKKHVDDACYMFVTSWRLWICNEFSTHLCVRVCGFWRSACIHGPFTNIRLVLCGDGREIMLHYFCCECFMRLLLLVLILFEFSSQQRVHGVLFEGVSLWGGTKVKKHFYKNV